MSQVSKELILELQTIIKEEYEKEVSFEEASEIANGLVGYFDAFARIDHGTNFVHKNLKPRAESKVIPTDKTISGT